MALADVSLTGEKLLFLVTDKLGNLGASNTGNDYHKNTQQHKEADGRSLVRILGKTNLTADPRERNENSLYREQLPSLLKPLIPSPH